MELINNTNCNNYFSYIEECKKKEKNIIGYKEKHHIIPKSFNGTNDISNLIYLSAYNHIVAHFLLWKDCLNIKDKKLISKSFLALNRMLNKVNQQIKNLENEDFNKLEYIFIEYENYKINLSEIISINNKGNTANKGRIWINKNSSNKMIYPQELDMYLKLGWEKGVYHSDKVLNSLKTFASNLHKNKIVSKDTRNKLSNNQEKRIAINKNNITKKIKEYELNNYLNDGWKLGWDENYLLHLKNANKNKPKRIWVNNGIKNIQSLEKDLDNYLNNGYKLGLIHYKNEKISITN